MVDLKSYPSEAAFTSILTGANYISRKPIYDFICDNKSIFSGKILDYGCGDMPYKELFVEADEYIGLDYAVTAESMGFSKKGVVLYDGKTIPFSDKTFDNTVCFQVLEHVQDPVLSLMEINRCMKTGGHLLLTLPANYPIHAQPYDYRRFTNFGIEQLLERCGFSIDTMEASTLPVHTLRRLRVYYGKYHLQKMRIPLTNFLFVLDLLLGKKGKNASDQSVMHFPLDWMVLCHKI